MKKERPVEPLVISEHALIEEALRSITMNKRGAVIVISDKKKVLGIVSDGDIRRSLVRGVNIMAPITKAMNANLIFAKKGSVEDKSPQIFFSKHPYITLLPIVTSNFTLSHIYKLPDASRSST